MTYEWQWVIFLEKKINGTGRNLGSMPIIVKEFIKYILYVTKNISFGSSFHDESDGIVFVKYYAYFDNQN
jgi:hypothetical protein